MEPSNLPQRTQRFGLRVIRAVAALPATGTAGILGRQPVRSGTSVGANYRAACRGKSRADFIHKLKIAEEECDESLYWMELLVGAELMPERRLAALRAEGAEILAILGASLRTARSRPVRHS
jgi:four helix bundle protein